MQPDLKLFELPPFENRKPEVGRLKLTGSTPTAVRPLHLGDEIVVVCRARVVGVDHTEITEAKELLFARVHKLQISEAHELPDGQVELERGRDWSRGVADAQRGTEPLWNQGGDEP